jgi:hypothetical protein
MGLLQSKLSWIHSQRALPPKTQTFLSLWARGIELTISYQIMSGMEIILEPKREFNVKRLTYLLVAMKLHTENGGGYGGAGRWAKKETIVLTYLATKGPGLDEWNLQKELSKIADFRSLAPNKAIARLGHFLTPGSSDHVWNLTKDNFEILDEDYFHQGCGYIPEGFIEELHHGNITRATRIHSFKSDVLAHVLGSSRAC